MASRGAQRVLSWLQRAASIAFGRGRVRTAAKAVPLSIDQGAASPEALERWRATVSGHGGPGD